MKPTMPTYRILQVNFKLKESLTIKSMFTFHFIIIDSLKITKVNHFRKIDLSYLT